jgi:hypothetical protein
MCLICRLGFAFGIVILSVSSLSARDPEKVLLEESRFEFIQVPLIQVLGFLSDTHKVQITIDVKTDVDEGITLEEKGPLGSLLTKILTPLGLKYRSDPRAITVEPIDPKAYSARIWEKRKEEIKAKNLGPKPKPGDRIPSRLKQWK